ncbi:mechanosensitive ion channel [Peribacillus alkalitolerans]|uniref:mechanosensitive ion channel n=1 Tax=Peribacillus alkalitolerans TaxID=1550385 RepID=UPI0013D34E31|nr:mechanosensitive ion channel [Peribacillus alkalitolerans]
MERYHFWNGWNSIALDLPDLIMALVVLFIGWMVAKLIEKVVEKGLKKTNLDNKLFPQRTNRKYTSEKIISKIIYYLILVFVFVLFFNMLSMSFIAAPFVNMLSSITSAIPRVLKAALILLFAWAIASALKFLIKKAGKTLRFNRLFSKLKMEDSHETSENIIDKVANIVFYLVLLIFLPAVLSALDIDGVAGPFTGMLHDILAFIPNLIGAALILFIGWFVAKLVRDIITNFLQSVGIEKFVQRMGLGKLIEGTSLSSIIGNIVFVLILIPVVIAALERLNIEGISEPAIAMLNDILTMIPNIIIAILFILAGLWIGKMVKKFVSGFLKRVGLDSVMNGIGYKGNPSTNTTSLSDILGYIAQIIVVLLFVVQALNIVKLEFLVTLATGVIAYLPHVIAALIILAVGLYVGNFVQKLLKSMFTGEHFTLLASIAKYAIIAIAFFMALDQLGVADTIVNAAFILILGGLALAFGLAFGLGGKDFATKYLNKLDHKIENTKVTMPPKHKRPSFKPEGTNNKPKSGEIQKQNNHFDNDPKNNRSSNNPSSPEDTGYIDFYDRQTPTPENEDYRSKLDDHDYK